jgi:hypothetical protein
LFLYRRGPFLPPPSRLGHLLDDLPYGYGDGISRSLQILRTNKS